MQGAADASRLGIFSALLLLVVGQSGCYVTRQALAFNDLFNSRQAVAKLKHDDSVAADLRTKLELVDAVLNYARGEGLEVGDAYQYFIDNRQYGVSYIVQASAADQLRAITWWFPIVGTVPYLGFFAKAERDAKAAQLEAEGYDVALGIAGAFSSLGYFADPLYASMLNSSDSELIHTLLHELIHRTFWAKDAVQFNENLAEYGAVLLTRAYLSRNRTAQELNEYEAVQIDRDLYREWLGRLHGALTDLYGHNPAMASSLLIQAKKQIFSEYLGAKLPSFHTDRYSGLASRPWNNATVLAASLYAPEPERFAAAYRCLPGQSFSAFLQKLAAAAEIYPDAFQALDSLCAGKHSSPI